MFGLISDYNVETIAASLKGSTLAITLDTAGKIKDEVTIVSDNVKSKIIALEEHSDSAKLGSATLVLFDLGIESYRGDLAKSIALKGFEIVDALNSAGKSKSDVTKMSELSGPEAKIGGPNTSGSA